MHGISNDHNIGAENATHLTRGADTATRGGSPLTNKHLNDFHNLKFENGNDCPDDLENSLEPPSPLLAVGKDGMAVIPTLSIYNKKKNESMIRDNSSNHIRKS